MLLCISLSLGARTARSQDSPRAAGTGAQQTGAAQQKALPDPVSRNRNIVADNLDHVAASVGQILEIVNHDVGLMVELKRSLAQDAGEGGQILEESDLSDDAVVLRLKEDLRARVIATRLLRRYGYLLPKLNPDSEQAQEQRLVLQERAQELARAAERNSLLRDSQPELAADCPTRASVCNSSPNSPAPLSTGSQPATRDRLPSDQDGPGENSPAVPPDMQNSPREQVIETAQISESTTMDIFSSSFSKPASPLAGRPDLAPNPDATLSPRDTPGSIANEGFSPIYPPGLPERRGAIRPNARDVASRETKPRTPEPYTYSEPVRMAHRPNPYAEIPSLYDLYEQASPRSTPAERFGMEIFRHGSANPTALTIDLPVGPEYVLGPGDGLSIDMWGGASQRFFQTVDPEGKVVLPEAGPLLVSGKSLGEAQQAVQHALRTQFRDISADVSLLKLRTVRVYVVGEVAAPGAYDVSSLSTPLNALFSAEGVTPIGSLRHLQHYRGSKLVQDVDAYDLLLHGVRGNMERLESGDSLRVPPVGVSVTVEGMVRRPAIYELREEANLSEVLELAGGLLPAAALRQIEVQRLEAHEKRTMLSLEVRETTDKEALRAALEKFRVRDGDEIHIFPIASYNMQAVYLEGHVLRPGRYAYRDGMTLNDLVASRADLLPEPAERYAEIIHLQQPQNRPVIESFSLSQALDHPETAPKLHALDTVRVFGRYDFEGPPEFLVFGEVQHPGRYRSSGQAHLRDAVYLAGGLTPEAWQDSGQLFRVMPDGTTKVFSVSLRDALSGDPLNNILIEPRDRILVHRQPERVNPPTVYIRGEVARPGRYPLAAGMTVSDLIQSAGGLLRSANPLSGDLTHYAEMSGSSAQPRGESQPVNLRDALAGEQTANLALLDGDVLTVPARSGWNNIGASVTISGEVGKPGVYGIQPGERVSSLLRRAGGLLPTAYPGAAVFERTSVREMQQKSREELIQRLEQESVAVKTSVTASGSDEAALQQAAVLQRQRIIDGLRRAPVSGRLVVHIPAKQMRFAGSSDDIELRAGDSLDIPKEPGSVIIVGQVYNSNAITFSPGKNAGWYLSRAGGATSFANKKATFIIRADGSVTSGKADLWSGGVLSSPVGPGDTIVVPEKVTVGGSALKNVVAIAQIAQAAALAAAVALP